MNRKQKLYLKKMRCKYCTVFQIAKDRTINEMAGREKHSRFCNYISEYVVSDTKACEGLTLYKYFWCTKCGYRLLIDVCFSREKCTCLGKKFVKNCKQRKLLKKWREYEQIA